MRDGQATQQGQGQQGQQVSQIGRQQNGKVSWTELSQPGAYVDSQTGDLYRVPIEALAGSSPLIHRESNLVGGGQLVQISENPFIPTSQARMLAASHDVQVNF